MDSDKNAFSRIEKLEVGKTFEKDLKLQSAMKDVLDLIKDLKVAYDREIRYRLETKYPHDLTKKAINELVKKREIRKTN